MTIEDNGIDGRYLVVCKGNTMCYSLEAARAYALAVSKTRPAYIYKCIDKVEVGGIVNDAE